MPNQSVKLSPSLTRFIFNFKLYEKERQGKT